MNKLIENFILIEKEIAQEKGDFALFGLFENEEVPNTWDVVISAPWFGEDKKKPLDFFVKKMKSKLSNKELVSLARVILLDPLENFVKTVNKLVQVEHKKTELNSCMFNGMFIKHGFVITSKKELSKQEEVSISSNP